MNLITQYSKKSLNNHNNKCLIGPLAMTDGAARLLELFGDEKIKAEAYPRLTR